MLFDRIIRCYAIPYHPGLFCAYVRFGRERGHDYEMGRLGILGYWRVGPSITCPLSSLFLSFFSLEQLELFSLARPSTMASTPPSPPISSLSRQGCRWSDVAHHLVLLPGEEADGARCRRPSLGAPTSRWQHHLSPLSHCTPP